MSTGSVSWPLWSTNATLVVTDESHLEAASGLVREYLAQVELAASRFRDDSEIVRLARAGNGLVPVSDVLADLLAAALLAAARSKGAVDPTVGTAMRRIGYDRDIELVLHDGAPVSATVRPVPGWRRIELNGSWLKLPRGVEVDLGATAKAVAADRCAALVRESLHTGVLVGLGGDIATAGPAPAGGWQVRVQDRPEDIAVQVTLGSGDAIATSSTVSRAWSRGGRQLHHIVDPATGQPAATPWRSVTVAARTCLDANTASTGTLAMGPRGLDWLSSLGLPARLVGRDGHAVAVNAWPGAAA